MGICNFHWFQIEWMTSVLKKEIVVQLPTHVWFFVTPQTAACQASLSFTISWGLLKPLPIELVMLSNHLILCHLLLLLLIFPSIRVFSNDQLFTSGAQNTGASASASVFSTNIQGWFPLRLTGLISLQSKGLSRVSSSTTIWKHQLEQTLIIGLYVCLPWESEGSSRLRAFLLLCP